MGSKNKFLSKMAEIGCSITSEQLQKCDQYEALLRKWQKKINLIGPSTVNEIYTRHILDAAQLLPFVPRGTLLDVGSGAGIPGIILSIFLDNEVNLCERIGKKASFLKMALRELGLLDHTKVLNKDIISINQTFDIITARAVTSIKDFLYLTEHNRHKTTLMILPKGGDYQLELESAIKFWSFDIEEHQSLTKEKAKILLLRNIQKHTS